jgi:P pilus assembly chaperone PapD
MKKVWILVLFMLAINLFASSESLKNLLKDYQNQNLNLSQGIVLPSLQNPTDFSIRFNNVKTVVHDNPYISAESMFHPEAARDFWYKTDFASEPFDGRIEVLVMGEPSASTTATLIISVLFGMLLLYKKKQTIEKTYGA